ncbi:MAG: single-stranded DNA-binding protein [bacterium]|nr:single-stranded DNA-binding protein [bacterium]
MYINKAMLFGNLTRDPELRALPSGGQVASFGIATNRVFKKADGSRAEATEFHNIVVFGRQAETAAQYLKKGSSVYIEGRIQTRSWDSPEKGKQYKTEIIAERVQFGPRPSGSGQPRDINTEEPLAPRSSQSGVGKDDAIDYPQEDINPDDIPF